MAVRRANNYTKQVVILDLIWLCNKNLSHHKKKYLLKSWIKKIRVLNHSQSFLEQPVKISVPYYKYFLRKSALHKHYINNDKIEQSGAP